MNNPSPFRRFVDRLRAPVEIPANFNQSVIDRLGTAGPSRRHRPLVALAIAAGLALAGFGLSRFWPGGLSGGWTEFVLEAPAATAVSLVGDFNDWDRSRTPLRRDAAGRWTAQVALAGGLYQYAFLIDGDRWVADPARPGVGDPDFGEALSLVTVE